MSKEYGGLFQPWEIAIAKSLINKFQTKRACLEKEDFEDLLQECLIAWFYARERHDPERGASNKTYMVRVVRNKLNDLVREREFDKRKLTSTTVSLNDPVSEGEDSTRLLDAIEADASSEPMSNTHLKIDLQRIMKRLPERQEAICRLLGEMGLTVQEASEHLNIPRGTIYDEIKRIREVFEKQGIQN